MNQLKKIILLTIALSIVSSHTGCEHDKLYKEFYEIFAREYDDMQAKNRFLNNP